MSSKKSNNRKSVATLEKKKSGRKSSCQAKQLQTKQKDQRPHKKIFPEHEPFIFLCVASGKSYQDTANAVKDEFEVIVTRNGIYDYVQRRKEQYEEFLAKIKEVRLANAKCRILDLQQIVDKLKQKIIEILGYVPRQWEELNLSSLISQFVNLMDQIRADCGDKAKDKNGEKREQTVIQIINTIPGMFSNADGNDTGKENTKAGRGFRLDRI